jgi:hypothetical protein
VVPAIVCYVYILALGVNSIYDEEALIPYLEAMRNGTLTFGMFYAQHLEHRIPFPRLVMLATAAVSQFNAKLDMYLYWLCLCALCGLLYLAYRRERGSGAVALLLFAPATFVVFSLRPWGNLLWGWQICWALTILFAALAIWFLQVRASLLSFVVAVACGVVATYSTAAGLAIWPAGLVTLLLLRDRPRVVAWTFVGGVVFIAYFHGYQPPGNDVAPFWALSHPLHALEFALTVLGAPLTQDPTDATALGLLLLALYGAIAVWTVRRPPSRAPVFWLGVMAFALLSSGVVTYGRLQFDLGQATISNYVPLGLLGIAALWLWAVTELDWRRLPGSAFGTILATLLVVGLVGGTSTGLHYGQVMFAGREEEVAIELNYQTATPTQLYVQFQGTPPPTAWLDFVRANHLSVFAEQP